MCGGAILAELIPSMPARRGTPSHLWPAVSKGKQQQRADDYKAAFLEFDEEEEEVESKPAFAFSASSAATRKLRSPDEEDEASESSDSGVLPDFSWKDMSVYEVEPPTAHPALEAAHQSSGGASKHQRTKPESADDEASPRASDSESDALFNTLIFGDQFTYFNGSAYESLDNLFSADAVQGSSAIVAADERSASMGKMVNNAGSTSKQT
ncbi:uncharacterized protein [Miscanthus floridulus]|uniref:uncharacterized protein n=1 Tax=Miscanthus floridulus TaxID=154761 RepID=UPI00345A1F8A